MRWLLLILTGFAFVLCFTRHSVGAWSFWLVTGIIGVIASTLVFAPVRLGGSSRSDSQSEHDLQRKREDKDPHEHERPELQKRTPTKRG